MRGRVGLGAALALGLALALGAAVLAWRWGPAALERWTGGEAAPEEAGISPEVAELTLDRLETFRDEGEGSRLSLGADQLSSVLRYALPGVLPPGVDEPTVGIREGKVHLSARVALATLPDLPALREVMGLLPDTVPVEVRGSLGTGSEELLLLQVESVEAARIPLPRRMIPALLQALGRHGQAGVPTDALGIPLPAGLRTAFILHDSLVLVADP